MCTLLMMLFVVRDGKRESMWDAKYVLNKVLMSSMNLKEGEVRVNE